MGGKVGEPRRAALTGFDGSVYIPMSLSTSGYSLRFCPYLSSQRRMLVAMALA
jgi:hypothetical protein